MKRAICTLAIVLVFAFGSTAVQAATNPVIAGPASGVELCPQFICGAAIFVGTFHGQIGNNFSANAFVTTVLKHGELPTVVDKSTPIFNNGYWEMRTLFRRFTGTVTGGTIVYKGNNLFHVTIIIQVLGGGPDPLILEGTLDHNPLIPTFDGVFQ